MESASIHVIVLPGGAYADHADYEAEPVASWLRGLGFASSVFRYPVGRRHPVPTDAIRAIIRRRRGEGAKRIVLLGFSAGGHAAGMVAYSDAAPDEQVDALVLCYPVVSMELPTHRESRHRLIGSRASPALRADTSLDRRVTSVSPPTFVWHTSDDEAVPVEHAYLLGGALARHRVPHELHVFASGAHGLGLAAGHPSASAWTRLAEEWLRGLFPVLVTVNR